MTTRGLLIALVALALTGRAHAQRVEADAAFRRGRALMARGQVAEACAAFEVSMRLEPTQGTLYNLGRCHQALGKLATAWAELTEVAENDTNPTRARDAARRAAALAPKLTRMRLVVKAPPPGLVVERDGVDVTAFVGQPTPVDAGRYTFEARAPGYQPAIVEAELAGEGATVEVAIPALALVESDADADADADAGIGAAPSTAVASRYPAELPLRPLALPRGMIEVSGSASLATAEAYETSPSEGQTSVRAGLGRVELEAGVGLHLRYATETFREDLVSAVSGAARYVFSPMLVGGIDYLRRHPTGGPDQRSRLRGLVARKWLVHPRVAVAAQGGFAFTERLVDRPATEFAVLGDGRLQWAALSRLSLEFFTQLSLNLGGDLYGHTTGLAVAGQALYAVTARLDLYVEAYADLLPTSDLRRYALGTSWRFH